MQGNECWKGVCKIVAILFRPQMCYKSARGFETKDMAGKQI